MDVPKVLAKSVTFEDDRMWVSLSDGRTVRVQLEDFQKLAGATSEQRLDVQIGAFGLHWEILDEDLSVPALLKACVRTSDIDPLFCSE